MGVVNGRLGKLLSPESFRNEKLRGAVTAWTTAIAANSLNMLGASLGMNPQLSSVLFLSLFGGLLNYALDILFAKEVFMVGGKVGPVPYGDLSTRFAWLLASLSQKYFFRYIITLLIDSIIFVAIFRFVKMSVTYKQLVPQKNKVVELLVAGGISLFTFVLYMNVLRFDWAYSHENNPILNMLVIIWLTIVVLVYVRTSTINAEVDASKDDSRQAYLSAVFQTILGKS